MKGLELAEQFFKERGLPMLQEQFPYLLDHITAGLVGQGSECLGFDDEISRDHDWGPSFCLWLPKDLYDKEHDRLGQAYDRLLERSFRGYPRREVTAQGGGRTGVLETGNFYYGFIGSRTVPGTNMEWFYAPETAYACVTNGKLFYRSGSEFEKVRDGLKQYYPEDVRLKKIAARAVTMAQAGQYNYVRCMKRKDTVAAFLALSEFVKATCSMLHLLHKQYMPFYKWAYRSVMELSQVQESKCGSDGVISHRKTEASPAKGMEDRTADRLSERKRTLDRTAEGKGTLKKTAEQLKALAEHPLDQKNADVIEQICISVKQELKLQNLTDLDHDFLEPHGAAIMSRIRDERVRALPVLFG